ncbi:unnamed protein product, partial [Meganyctiphanes norvegica]
GVKIREPGSTWFDGCKKMTCESGNINKEFAKNKCCKVNGTVYTDGQKWYKGCYEMTCKSGIPISTGDHILKTCCKHKGKVYENDQTWEEDCYQNTCSSGKVQTSPIPNK